MNEPTAAAQGGKTWTVTLTFTAEEAALIRQKKPKIERFYGTWLRRVVLEELDRDPYARN